MLGNQMSLDHLLILKNACTVGILEVPQLEPIRKIPVISKCLPINLILSQNIQNVWGHCFVEDKRQNCFWNNPFFGIERLKKLKGMIAPDYSLFRDFPICEQKWNCCRNRVLTYFWQQQGLNVVPTASWSVPASYEWCWDGLPENSVLGITTNGIVTAKEGYRLFVQGLDALIVRLHPIALVVCGHFFPWMQKKYPKVRMIKIKSYGQLWNERKKRLKLDKEMGEI